MAGTPCQPSGFADLPFPFGWARESPTAARLCLNWCPLLGGCRVWAAEQPEPQPGVLGGMGLHERLAVRRERAEALAEARAERAREVSRNSERRRTMLGINARYQRDAYKKDPEPRRALNAAYYAANSEALKAKARARYAAAKAAD
jgi:Transcription factor WhiB